GPLLATDVEVGEVAGDGLPGPGHCLGQPADVGELLAASRYPLDGGRLDGAGLGQTGFGVGDALAQVVLTVGDGLGLGGQLGAASGDGLRLPGDVLAGGVEVGRREGDGVLVQREGELLVQPGGPALVVAD